MTFDFSPKHIDYILNHLDEYTEPELNSIYKYLDVEIKEKSHQKFIEYNIRDVELVEKLNAKGGLIDMALTLAYDNKTNYEDVFSQVRMWDAICYNHLRRKGIVIPPKKHTSKDKAYEGAYVKEPQIGIHTWVASLDLNSLYPHLIMQYNMSPETIIEPAQYTQAQKQILEEGVTVTRLLHKRVNLPDSPFTITPNGQFFTKMRHGFLPEIMQKMYDDRVVYKKKQIEAQKELEEIKREMGERGMEYDK